MSRPAPVPRASERLIGESPPRKEDAPLLIGEGNFLDDLRRPRTVHLGVVRSLHAHARLLKVHTAVAAAGPGVLAAFAAADLPEVESSIPAPYGRGQGARPFTLAVLARDVVRYVGEPVAVVVAEDPYRLADALEQVAVDYEVLPAVVAASAARPVTTLVHAEWPDNVALAVRGAVGDVEQALARADLVVHERLRHPRLTGVPIETRGALAYPDQESGGLVLWSSTQNPYLVRDAVAGVLGLEAERIRVLAPDVGGAFGLKGAAYPEEVLVAAVALRLGRPVKWVETRREHFTATGHDREQVHEVRVGFRRDGTILAVDGSFLADVGAYPIEGDGLSLNTVNHLPGPYRVPHYRSLGYNVVTHKTVNVAYRGAGRPEAVFVMERLVDIGARRLGLDPADVRRRNLVRPEEMPYRPGLTYKDGTPIAYDPGDFPAAFEEALARLGYAEWRARQAARRGTTRRIGIGLGCYAQGSGLGPYEGATIRVDPGGTVYVLIGVAAQGQGHATTLAQICAAELGAAFADVVVVAGDTTVHPFGMGTGGSRVAANAGPAVARTARAVRAKATRVAAELLECAPEDVRIEEGRAHVAGMPGRSVPLGRVAHAAIRSRALREVGEPGLSSCAYFYPETVTWAFGTQAAAVEVDVETCETRLLAYVAVHDSGRPINPTIVEGQLHGGAVQGIAAGLWEELVYDGQGQLLTGSLMDYALPKADQVPPLEVAQLPHPSVVNELGIKGVGESGAIPGAAVVANAIEDALADFGITIREVPVTPARLFALLRAAPRE
jgi:carbon-monoxide dehydrogenase large subunit